MLRGNRCRRAEASLFHHPEREVGCSWRLKRADVLQVDRLRAEAIEEAHALTQQHMSNGHMKFVEQTGLQCLLNGACTVQGHIFLACDLLCFRHRAFNAIGDKVKLRVTLFHGFSWLRLQDNHRPGERRAVRHYPPLLTVNLIEASVSHDYRASLAERIAHDFMEMFHCPPHPGEDLRYVIIFVGDKSIQ